MSRLIILGATGSLGRHVLRQALAAGHQVTVFVRTPSKLPPEAQARVSVHTGDLAVSAPIDLIKGQDALINCAGHVADGESFANLVDRLVTADGVAAGGLRSPSAGSSRGRRSWTSTRQVAGAWTCPR